MKTDKEIEIYVTIPVVPNRAFCIQQVIDSYLTQTLQPKKIFINICKKYKRFPDETYDISQLDKYKDNELIQINYADEDLGPITGTLEGLNSIKINKNKIQYLYQCDDDKVTKPVRLARFRSQIRRNADVAYGGRCMLLRFKRGRYGFDECQSSHGSAWNVQHLQGLRVFYDSMVEKMPEMFYHDDTVIAIYLHTNGIKLKRVHGGGVHHLVDDVEGTQKDALSKYTDDLGATVWRWDIGRLKKAGISAETRNEIMEYFPDINTYNAATNATAGRWHI